MSRARRILSEFGYSDIEKEAAIELAEQEEANREADLVIFEDNCTEDIERVVKQALDLAYQLGEQGESLQKEVENELKKAFSKVIIHPSKMIPQGLYNIHAPHRRIEERFFEAKRILVEASCAVGETKCTEAHIALNEAFSAFAEAKRNYKKAYAISRAHCQAINFVSFLTDNLYEDDYEDDFMSWVSWF
jgi:hypothetical protein